MIPVIKQMEPKDFDKNVRKRGQTFLTSCPAPKAEDWKRRNYWKYANKDLYYGYNGVCAYTGEWFPLTTGTISVDHFQPKSLSPHLAYEWDNFRLTTPKTNNNKADYIIVDPFTVESGWFVLLIPSCLIVSGENLTPSIQATVDFTIEKLKLNLDEDYVQRRLDIILDFISGDISLIFLQRHFPFIANELQRQNIADANVLSKYFIFSTQA